MDGAEKHLRAALALDPRNATSHTNLGVVYAARAQQSERSGNTLRATAALWDQAVQHFTNAVALGDDDRMLDMLKLAKEAAARVRKGRERKA